VFVCHISMRVVVCHVCDPHGTVIISHWGSQMSSVGMKRGDWVWHWSIQECSVARRIPISRKLSHTHTHTHRTVQSLILSHTPSNPVTSACSGTFFHVNTSVSEESNLSQEKEPLEKERETEERWASAPWRQPGHWVERESKSKILKRGRVWFFSNDSTFSVSNCLSSLNSIGKTECSTESFLDHI
jgi:hypothetical protein